MNTSKFYERDGKWFLKAYVYVAKTQLKPGTNFNEIYPIISETPMDENIWNPKDYEELCLDIPWPVRLTPRPHQKAEVEAVVVENPSAIDQRQREGKDPLG